MVYVNFYYRMPSSVQLPIASAATVLSYSNLSPSFYLQISVVYSLVQTVVLKVRRVGWLLSFQG